MNTVKSANEQMRALLARHVARESLRSQGDDPVGDARAVMTMLLEVTRAARAVVKAFEYRERELEADRVLVPVLRELRDTINRTGLSDGDPFEVA